MKKFISIAALGLAAFGFTSPAFAFHFLPKDTSFTAKGSLTVTAGAVSLPCTATLHGTTEGGAKITSASFSGLTCLALTASDLPWKMTPANDNNVNFKDMSVSATVLGICGPGNVRAHLSTNGVISISGAGLKHGLLPCSVSGTFRTNPKLSIVPH
jgi:hypothetical protein